MSELLHPIVADANMSQDMAQALMLLQVEYSNRPDTVLTEEQVRSFIRATDLSHVADEFRDYYLLFAD